MTHATTTRRTLRGTVATAALAAAGVTQGGAAHAERPGGRTLDIGTLLYDGYSLLEPTGPAEVLSQLPGANMTMIAERRGPVRTDTVGRPRWSGWAICGC
ncbi:hypothetical protein [Streptomyces sp. NPDC059479]|uniref:hypothetical protein n=1 Tax=Streptomyces sp. NPDC059479 TaxID=3346848 RepID=UPI003694E578